MKKTTKKVKEEIDRDCKELAKLIRELNNRKPPKKKWTTSTS